MQDKELKSYLSDVERQRLIHEAGMDAVYAAEAQRALHEGEEENAWKWLSQGTLPTSCLKSIKRWRGADFIRQNGFNTKNADQELGADWLERSL